MSDSSTMDTVSIMCIYSAYLVATHDGQTRHAFNMLYELETMFDERKSQH
jgi:hypothetical protein